MGLALPARAAEQLVRHLRLIERWNRAMNLTAVSGADDMVARHVLDSLSAAPWVLGRRLLDVGSGAGFPGLPLAVARPDLEVMLLDRRDRKVRFLVQVLAILGVPNARAECGRAEQRLAGGGFDTVISRALAPPAAALRICAGLCRPGGRIIVMCGRDPGLSPAQLAAAGLAGARIVPATVPGLGARRCLLLASRP